MRNKLYIVTAILSLTIMISACVLGAGSEPETEPTQGEATAVSGAQDEATAVPAVEDELEYEEIIAEDES